MRKRRRQRHKATRMAKREKRREEAAQKGRRFLFTHDVLVPDLLSSHGHDESTVLHRTTPSKRNAETSWVNPIHKVNNKNPILKSLEDKKINP